MSNDYVIRGLISFYKDRGINLSYLLNDPVFTRLPVKEQAELLQRNAHMIKTRPSDRFGSDFFKRVTGGAVVGGASGAYTGFRIGQAAGDILGDRGIAKGIAALSGATVGTLIGGVIGANSSFAKSDQRDQFHNSVVRLQENPTAENAVRALSANVIPKKDISTKITELMTRSITPIRKDLIHDAIDNSFEVVRKDLT